VGEHVISITINTTPKQDTKLAKILAVINASRVTPYADVAAMFTDILRNQLLSYNDQIDEFESQAVAKAFKAASDQVQAQVKTDLGI
jgi:hypothetical protein